MSAGAKRSGPLLALAGAVIGAFASLCGVGGGIFAVPFLHYVFGVPLQAAIATSLCLVAANAFSSTLSEWTHAQGVLVWPLIGASTGGALLGAQIGYAIARRIKTRALKAVFCVVLAFVGTKLMFFDGGGRGGSLVPGFEPGAADLVLAGVVGVFAGIAVPLLGVGGGIILVPALIFGVPEIGYLGARATSLAQAVVTSSRSVSLYLRDKLIDWSTARWFAAGALVGAFSGVQLVHLHGAAEIAEICLGLTLCFAAVRFGWDVYATRDRASG